MTNANNTKDTDVKRREPDADCFRQGDVWMSPKGFLYRVIEVKYQQGKDRKQAELRMGSTGPGGRKVVRDWDAILNGWTRVEWGGVRP